MCNRVLFFILTEQNHIQVADARIMYDVKSELVSLETRFKIHLSRIPILSFIMPSCLMCVLSTCHMICHQFYCPFLTAYFLLRAIQILAYNSNVMVQYPLISFNQYQTSKNISYFDVT